REIVAAIRRVLLGVGSPPTDILLSGDPDVMVLDRRVNEAWKLRQGSHYMELGQLLPGLLVDAQVASQEIPRRKPDAGRTVGCLRRSGTVRISSYFRTL